MDERALYRNRPAVRVLMYEVEKSGGGDVTISGRLAQAIVDDIHTETYRTGQTAWLCARRGDRLEHHKIPNVYLSGCVGGDHRDLHTFAAQETGL